MPALVDQFCPNVHDAPITAASYDPLSGTIATADARGMVAVQRPGEATPNLVFHPGGQVRGSLALIRGGTHVAVGDEDGTIGVYRCDNGESVFQDRRDGGRGRVRAMRGVALSPDCSKLAAIAADGLLRIWYLAQNERNAWSGFSGTSVEFDPRGERLLAMDKDGQPRLMDLSTLQAIYMDRLQTPASVARFNGDGTMVVAAGQAGISLLRVYDGAMVGSFATKGGGGILNLVLAPDGSAAGAVTQRSVHIFTLPDLQPSDSRKHGAPEPTGAAIWLPQHIKVAGNDGLLHSGGTGSAGPVTAMGGFGEFRLAAHGDKVALWKGDRRLSELAVEQAPRELHVDRDGRLMVSVPLRGPLEVYNLSNGRKIMDGGPPTSGATEVAVGGTVVAALLRAGGLRWWELGTNRGFELKWPRSMALSNGGTWLGVVTPRGAVRVLDPQTGTDALPSPTPLAEVPIKALTFVNRRPDLIVLDEEGVLGHYDLSISAQKNQPANGRDVLTINVPVDRMWGITGGQFCALRLPDQDRCSIIFVDIHACEVVHEVAGLSAGAWVDAETGAILEPGRSAAVVERSMDGREQRVLRALPDGEWLSYGWRGILQASAGAASVM